MNADEHRFEEDGTLLRGSAWNPRVHTILHRICIICVYLCSSVVLILMNTGCAQMEAAGSFGKRMYEFVSGRTPINAAVRMENQQLPDERREGINDLANRSFGRAAPYTERYQQIAQSDKDWLVRATAIRALNRSRDESAKPAFVRALSDENDIVRVEACKALVHMPDPAAAPVLIKLVADANQDRDVRIWAADALQHYRTIDVARTLAAQLRGREFGVAWQSHKSLVSLTGQDLSYDENAWLQYLTSTQNPFG
jgi:hypothetical protein